MTSNLRPLTTAVADDAGNVTYSQSLKYLVTTRRPVAGLSVHATGDTMPPWSLPDAPRPTD